MGATRLGDVHRDVLVEIVLYIPKYSADAACLKMSCRTFHDLLSNKLS